MDTSSNTAFVLMLLFVTACSFFIAKTFYKRLDKSKFTNLWLWTIIVFISSFFVIFIVSAIVFFSNSGLHR